MPEATSTPAPTIAPLRSVMVLDAPNGGWGIAVSCESPPPTRPRPKAAHANTSEHNGEGKQLPCDPSEQSPEESNESKVEDAVDSNHPNPAEPKKFQIVETCEDDEEHSSHASEPARFRMRREEAFPGLGAPAPNYRYFGEDVQRRFRAMKAAAETRPPVDQGERGKPVEEEEPIGE